MNRGDGAGNDDDDNGNDGGGGDDDMSASLSAYLLERGTPSLSLLLSLSILLPCPPLSRPLIRPRPSPPLPSPLPST